MAAAAVLIPLSEIHLNGGVLPPSAIAQHAPRQGRSRGMSVKKGGNGGRGYNPVESSDATVAKAVTFVLKRAVTEAELESDLEDAGEYLIADAEGWVSAAELLNQPRMKDLGITLAALIHASASPKARFVLHQLNPGTGADAAAYRVRQDSKRDSSGAAPSQQQQQQTATPVVTEGAPLSPADADLPEYLVYETSLQNYPLVLASGGIRRPDGCTHLSFTTPVSSSSSGSGHTASVSKAEVCIWIHLRTAMQQSPGTEWYYRAMSGRRAVVTAAEEVPRALWTRAVARRPDLGTLFEDGEVRKEVPEALRGKGARGKARKGKGKGRGGEAAREEVAAGSGSGSESGSLEEEEMEEEEGEKNM
ncbi:putative tRNA 2'-phosphotransferase 1 [Xylariomycetidae sp. FL2044]|nr:putative tRNA 2'-phosphotransferase 1 [Xylariomycetidae sp. FL2044]